MLKYFVVLRSTFFFFFCIFSQQDSEKRKGSFSVRFSEFCQKEIIDLDNGERMGVLGQSDLLINPESGVVESVIIHGSSFLGLGKKRDEVEIPWKAIRKIGPDMIIVELQERGKETF
jgi:YlmC/YmxH family sporulation protein